MKLIDEKGRLFGKINVIDFAVILFLLCLTPMFYFGYKIFNAKPVTVPEVYIETEVNCKFIKLKPEILKQIEVGDREKDASDATIGEITWLGNSKPYQHRIDIGAGNIEIREDPTLKELPVKLKLKASIDTNSIYYKRMKIFLNSPIEFMTNKYIISAIPEI